MKLTAIIILLSLAPGILVPPALALTFSRDDLSCIGTIDVCNSAVPALASGGEMPCVPESISGQRPAVSVITFDQAEPLFLLIAILFPIEKPPRS